MKPVFTLFFVAALVTACSQQVNHTSQVETTVVIYPDSVKDIIDTLPELNGEFALDSTFFQKDSAVRYDLASLSSEMVKLLSSKMAYDQTSQREIHYLNAYYDIQKAKENDSFPEYISKLEGGMTQNAVTGLIGKKQFNDSLGLLIWELKYKSTDSIPSYTGHHVLGSLFSKGKMISCMHLGNHDTGYDPPMSYEMFQLFSINEHGWITIRNHSESKEEQAIVERNSKYLNFKITNRGFKYMP